MITYTETEVRSLIERFERCELPKSEWTHEAHLLVAVWYVTHYPFDQAMDLTRKNISAHNTSVGTPNTDTEGYHETITKFWLLITSEFIKRNSGGSLSGRCNALILSEYGRSSYPLTFYTPETLFSVRARHNWVEPDLREIGIMPAS